MSAAALHVDFGDGSGAYGASVQHIYASAGSYVVTVTATDGAGNRSTATRTIQIAPAPVALPDTTLTATTAATWDLLRNGRTRMKTLVVEGLTGPETVRLECKDKRKGCRRAATRKVTKHGRKLDFTKQVKGMTLRPKARLVVTVTRPGYVTRVFTYTMIAKNDPKKTTRCLPPGARKAGPC